MQFHSAKTISWQPAVARGYDAAGERVREYAGARLDRRLDRETAETAKPVAGGTRAWNWNEERPPIGKPVFIHAGQDGNELI